MGWCEHRRQWQKSALQPAHAVPTAAVARLMRVEEDGADPISKIHPMPRL